MRIDELINLRWSDIDLEKKVLHVRVQEEWKPKGRRDRVIAMHPKVEAVIRKSLDTMLRYLADVSVEDSVQSMQKAVQRLAAS